jgi:predicted O-linked N-acetylglucosamine transferase (SPINDLY family)
LADRFLIPDVEHEFYSEKIIYLPDSYQVNDAKRQIAAKIPNRAECQLSEGAFVFCSFNNCYKITPAVFDTWMRLLQNVDGSVLWLLESNSTAVANLRRAAQERGVSAERLVFAPKVQLSAHLARLRLADLFLDTVPCNAHTTASDALWVGVPVLTCSGPTLAGRVAGSLLRAIGLSELITYSLDDYEALALKLARDPTFLGLLKTIAANNRMTFPLFNTKRFTRHIEAAFETMWRTWQRGGPPHYFSIDPIAE